MGHSSHNSKHRSRSRHRSSHRSRHHRRSSSSERYHRKNHRRSSERELRKKQDRLARARLLLLSEENVTMTPIEDVQPMDLDKPEIRIKDELEMDEDPVETNQSSHNGEPDPLDLYMQEISKQAAPQEGVAFKKPVIEQQSFSEEEMEIDDELESEEYRNKFLEAFRPKRDIQPEAADKPQVIYDEEDDTAWDFLLAEDEDDDFLHKQRTSQEKRKLPTVNHQEMEYLPFRKDLYIVCPELQAFSYDEILDLREELGGIKVRGKRCPAPILNWFQCGLSDKILRLLERKKFKGPFPIQAQAIPAIMSGRDVIGIAETGSGKTLAYLLPMLRHIMDQKPVEAGEGPISLIMAPTRELAFQIYNETKVTPKQSFCKILDLRCICVYGGTGVSNQLSDLKKGAEIVVCTPGRMIDVLCLSNGKITNLNRVTYLVIDEADRMFDLGFEPQISKIINNTRPDRQTVMFSATFPKHVENLAKKILHKPVEIVVGGRNQTCASIEQFVEVFEDEDEKFPRLLDILEDWVGNGNILIFVERQSEADHLFKDLVKEGHELLVLHGGHDQTDRDFAIADFRRGEKTLMVATSIAARGLDVKSLVLVINYSCPNHMEDYIHRIGRTGRAGNKGTAITFITRDEMKYAWELIKVLEHSGQEIPEELQDLALEFKQMVEEGEAKPYRSRGFGGKGFQFSKEEVQKVKNKRKKLKKGYVFSDSDTDSGGEELKAPLKRSEMTLADFIKEPKIRQAAMSAAQTAAKAAIISGNADKAMQAAKEAIEMVVLQLKQEPDPDEGMDSAVRVRDDWLARSMEERGRAYVELDINDYTLSARARVMSRDYLNTIKDLTGCTVSVRGTYVDPAKKTGLGQRRLHLFIEGPTRPHCNNAKNEIKRFLEELSPSMAMLTYQR